MSTPLDEYDRPEIHAPFYRKVQDAIAREYREHPELTRSQARRNVLNWYSVWDRFNYDHLMAQRGMAVVKNHNDHLSPEHLFGIPEVSPFLPFSHELEHLARRNAMLANRAEEIFGRSPMQDLAASSHELEHLARCNAMVANMAEEIFGRSPMQDLAAFGTSVVRLG